jgi:hypothetical protein
MEDFLNHTNHLSHHFVSQTLLVLLLFSLASAGYWVNFNGSNQRASINITKYDQANNVIADNNITALRSFNIAISVPSIQVADYTQSGVVYKKICVPDFSGWTTEDHKPAIPVKIVMFEIPYGSTPAVTVSATTAKYLPNYNILPVGSAGTPTSDYYPVNTILKSEVYTIRNRQYLRLVIALAKARTDNNDFVVRSSVTLHGTITPSSTPAPYPVSPTFEMLARGESAGVNTGRAPERYMIIMNSQFLGNSDLEAFINWKRLKGYEVSIVTTSDIKIGGQPIFSEIRSYMRNLPANQFPVYLLIIGDGNAETGVSAFDDNYWYTDVYLADRDNDILPIADCFYGRLPARNTTELSIMLKKAMLMDRNPPISATYDKVLVAGLMSWKSDDKFEQSMFCETPDGVATYFENDAGGINYTCKRIITNPVEIPPTCFWYPSSFLWDNTSQIGTRVWNTLYSDLNAASNDVMGAFNNGLNLVFHRNHGVEGGWEAPQFGANVVRDYLTPVSALPVVYSINCLTGSYFSTTSNFTMEMLLNPSNGAYAIIAPTANTYSLSNDWMSHGIFMGLFENYRPWHSNNQFVDFDKDLPKMAGYVEGSARKLGPNLDFGKFYMLQNWDVNLQNAIESFHVFGDPEGEIVIHAPQTQVVTHPWIIPTGQVSFNVRTDANGVQVSLYSAALNIHQVAIAQGGVASFTINSGTSGWINVTVTGFSKRPYEGIIIVGPRTKRLENCFPATQGNPSTYTTLNALQDNSSVYCQLLNTSWPSQYWIIEPVTGESDKVRLKCQWSNGTYYYLTATGTSGAGNGDPVKGKILSNGSSSQMWIVENGRNGSKRFKSAWSNSTYLTTKKSTDMSDVVTQPNNPDWASQEWNIR